MNRPDGEKSSKRLEYISPWSGFLVRFTPIQPVPSALGSSPTFGSYLQSIKINIIHFSVVDF